MGWWVVMRFGVRQFGGSRQGVDTGGQLTPRVEDALLDESVPRCIQRPTVRGKAIDASAVLAGEPLLAQALDLGVCSPIVASEADGAGRVDHTVPRDLGVVASGAQCVADGAGSPWAAAEGCHIAVGEQSPMGNAGDDQPDEPGKGGLVAGRMAAHAGRVNGFNGGWHGSRAPG